MHSPLAPHVATPAELQARNALARACAAFLVWRDDENKQILLALEDDSARVTIGRGSENDVALHWDERVSRLHAELERVGGEWVIVDDGLSTNGTWIGGSRLVGRKRLRDGDLLEVGGTLIAFCSPRDPRAGTALGDRPREEMRISPAQRRVLVALCRPFLTEATLAVAPSNQEIAQELSIGLESVRSHLKALFAAFGLEGLPAAQKRAALVERAVRAGVVTRRDAVTD